MKRHLLRPIRLLSRFVHGVLVFAVLAAVVGLGCAPTPEPVVIPQPDRVFQVVAPDQWPDLVDDMTPESFAAAAERALRYLDALPPDQVLKFGELKVTSTALADSIRTATQVVSRVSQPRARAKALKKEMVLVKSVGRDGTGEVLFTGYYEPVLEARRTAVGEFVHPLYQVPDDLVTADLEDFGLDAKRITGRIEDRRLVPYPDRHNIDALQVLDGMADVLGFLADPVEAFFLHVQGSGQLRFADGSRLRAGYAATNGRPYRSIGKLLIDEGLVAREDMSMQAIVGYLSAHPDEVRRVLDSNPSYVFFRPLPADDGPLGCYRVPLIPGRSIATDRRLFPAPAVAWIRGALPAPGGGDRPFSRLALNLDTGGIIKGPDRVDLFFGQGDEAADLAGRTTHIGELYFLLPRTVVQ